MSDQMALNSLTKARAALILDQPFFGSLALRLRLVEATSVGSRPIKTMAVDGKHIFYNPEFVKELSLKHLIFVVAHEVMHCVWQHMTRRGARDPKKWNMAGDYVINDMLKNLKDSRGNHSFEMPDMGLWSAAFSGPDWTADKVYNHLPDPPPDKQGTGEAGGAMDDVLDGEDASERAQMEREWKVATIQAANGARMHGKLPADLERLLVSLLKPQVNWVERLRNFVSETTKDDYNWTRPNRRFEDIYLPSLFDETVGDIAVVIDDSGSISDKVLQAFGAEIAAIMQDVRPKTTHLMYCDAAVSAHYELGPDDTPEFRCHGGGGTDFAPPFEMLAEKEIIPKCLIYLTDLCGPHGPEAPYPVLWVCVTDLIAPWGETLPIDVKE